MTKEKDSSALIGYEATFVEVLERKLVGPNTVGNRQTFRGAFQIPAGIPGGTIHFGKFDWGDSRIELRSNFFR